MNMRVFDLYVYVIRYACDMHELYAENLLLDLGHLALSVFAINSTVSTSINGPFEVTAAANEFLQTRSGWSNFPFYVKVDENVKSFTVYIMSSPLVPSPDLLTTLVDIFATYNPINVQEITWVVQTGVLPLVYAPA